MHPPFLTGHVLGLFAVLLIFTACTSPPPLTNSPSTSFFDIEGHRGARGLKPENTLPAFETALDLGVTTLELDLHYTADRVVVVWHDDAVDARKCRLDPNASPPLPPDPEITPASARHISALTFAQLQKYRCDRNPDPKRFPQQSNAPTALADDDYHIISLARLFTFVEEYAHSSVKSKEQRQRAMQVQFSVETKRNRDDPLAINDGWVGVHPGDFEQHLVALVESRGLVERVIVQSFVPESLWAVHSLNPGLRLSVLTRKTIPDFRELAGRGATIWSPYYRDVTAKRIRQAHEAGLLVIPWTVNNPDTFARLRSLDINGIITDRPDVVRAGSG